MRRGVREGGVREGGGEKKVMRSRGGREKE